MNRPKAKTRLPELLYIIGCEGKNQERLYFERIKKIINENEHRKMDVNFMYAEPYGGDPLCVVERTYQKSIGKKNKISAFDFDNKRDKYEKAIDYGNEKSILLGYTNYCFDLWLILHKEDYCDVVSNQNDYAEKVREVYGLPTDANVKKETRVTFINEQIDLFNVRNAIIRAQKIEKNNRSKPGIPTPGGFEYYDNPDTQMHNVLMKILEDVGLK